MDEFTVNNDSALRESSTPALRTLPETVGVTRQSCVAYATRALKKHKEGYDSMKPPKIWVKKVAGQ